MSTLQSNYDALEQLILDENLSITAVNIHKDLDLMLIVLNTKAILRQKISAYKNLSKASEDELKQYSLICGGRGIHWQLLDEDLSLKGFLQQEIRQIVSKDAVAA